MVLVPAPVDIEKKTGGPLAIRCRPRLERDDNPYKEQKTMSDQPIPYVLTEEAREQLENIYR